MAFEALSAASQQIGIFRSQITTGIVIYAPKSGKYAPVGASVEVHGLHFATHVVALANALLIVILLGKRHELIELVAHFFL